MCPTPPTHTSKHPADRSNDDSYCCLNDLSLTLASYFKAQNVLLRAAASGLDLDAPHGMHVCMYLAAAAAAAAAAALASLAAVAAAAVSQELRVEMEGLLASGVKPRNAHAPTCDCIVCTNRRRAEERKQREAAEAAAEGGGDEGGQHTPKAAEAAAAAAAGGGEEAGGGGALEPKLPVKSEVRGVEGWGVGGWGG